MTVHDINSSNEKDDQTQSANRIQPKKNTKDFTEKKSEQIDEPVNRLEHKCKLKIESVILRFD